MYKQKIEEKLLETWGQGQNMTSNTWTVDKLKEVMSKYDTAQYDWNVLQGPLSEMKKAAVLVPLVIVNGEIHMWLTKRSNKVGHDKGHVSFPGGMRDAADRDAIATALREAEEEIGLHPQHVIAILAKIPPRVNLREYLVTPVVALVSESFVPVANDEVEFAFCVPVEKFLKGEDHWSGVSARDGFQASLASSNIHFFNYVDAEGREATTFDITASMCITVACAVIGRKPDYEYSSSNQIDPLDPFRGAVEYLDYYCSGKAKEFFKLVRQQGQEKRYKKGLEKGAKL